jgi:small subunit ribosomal protein S2
LKELERGHEENAFEFYTKKERLLLERERTRLDRYLQGVKDMARVPGAMFVVDAKRETIAVREAHRLNIPVFAITDTNADPDLIDYPIPGNDDAIRSVGLIAKALADSIEVAQREIPEEDRRRVEDLEATTYSTETGEKTAEAVEQPARRPKRKRRPVPDAIAKVRKPSGEDSGEEEVASSSEDSGEEEVASSSEPEAASGEASDAEATSEPEAVGEEAVAESEAAAETKDESPTEEAPEAEAEADGEKETSSES